MFAILLPLNPLIGFTQSICIEERGVFCADGFDNDGNGAVDSEESNCLRAEDITLELEFQSTDLVATINALTVNADTCFILLFEENTNVDVSRIVSPTPEASGSPFGQIENEIFIFEDVDLSVDSFNVGGIIQCSRADGVDGPAINIEPVTIEPDQ